MYKYLVFFGILIISIPSFSQDSTFADICTKSYGKIVVANNGQEYCMSKNKMNWWTALGWCQTMGRTHIRYPLDCNCFGDNCPLSGAQCPNFLGVIYDCWTATRYNSENSYRIGLNGGMIYTNSPYNGANMAMCK